MLNNIRDSALFWKKALSPAILLCFFICAAPLWATEIAIIVNKANTVQDVSFDDLRKIFMAEKYFWDNGDKIYLLLRETGSPEKTVMLDVVYRMDAKDLKQFWLAKLYRQEIAAFPKTLKSNEAVKRFVAQAPNAIGFIDGRHVDSTVKALTVDGKSIHAPGYPLTDQSP